MNHTQPADPKQAIGQAIEAIMLIAQHAPHIAHVKRTIYMSYLSEGFTEAQALELTKSFGGFV